MNSAVFVATIPWFLASAVNAMDADVSVLGLVVPVGSGGALVKLGGNVTDPEMVKL